MRRMLNKIISWALMIVLLGCVNVSIADDEDADSLYETGLVLLLSDDSTEADLRAGMDNIIRSAQMESPDAAYTLGFFYENGLFVEQDYEEAFAWYYQSLQYGSIDAVYKIGQFAEQGKGMEKDDEMAVTAYQLASEFGHTDAMKALAFLWLRQGSDAEKQAAAKDLFEKAAKNGDIEAMNNIAWCYEYGIGTLPDYRQAGDWFAKAQGITDEKMFYGMNPESVFQKAIGDLACPDSADEEFCMDFYKAIWIRKHVDSQETAKSRHIVIAMTDLYPSIEEEQLSKAVFDCIAWIYSQEPELEEKTEETGYGDVSKYARSSVSQVYFNNGYRAFEERNYPEAERNYKICIDLDPCDYVARFELTETYIETGRLNQAKQELNNLPPYIMDDASKAHYYRRVGYIAIDERDYELGGACMLYSLRFSESEIALGELMYIQGMTGKNPDYNTEQIKKILGDNRVYIWEIE